MSLGMFEIPGSDSGRVAPMVVPMAQYAINDTQQVAVIGVDFDVNPVEFGSSVMQDGSVCKTEHLGKLHDQSFVMQQQLRNSMNNDEWDFEKYHNPEVMVLTQELS